MPTMTAVSVVLAPSQRWEPLSTSSSSSIGSSSLSLPATPALSTTSSSSSSSTLSNHTGNNHSNNLASTSSYCTGRSRSNTLTSVLNSKPNHHHGLFSDDLAAALGNLSINSGGVRPRKGSVVQRERASSFSTTIPSLSATTASASSASSTTNFRATLSPSTAHSSNTSLSLMTTEEVRKSSTLNSSNVPAGKAHPTQPNQQNLHSYPPRPFAQPATALMPSALDDYHPIGGYRDSKEEPPHYYHHHAAANSDYEPLLQSSLSVVDEHDHLPMTNTKTSMGETGRTLPQRWSIFSSSSGWNFLLRVLVLAGLFMASLGGLYLMAKLLPPLALPKSIEDVKEDAVILQQFATADYDGWLRTFWVFSAVYIWKQSFGIPGSAFLNILAGALYGPWFGTLLTSLLTTAGSVVAYFVSWFLMEPILERYASARLDQMRRMIQKKANGHSSSGKKHSTNTHHHHNTTSEAPVITLEVGTRQDSNTTTTTTASAVTLAHAAPVLRSRSSSFTSRQTIIHIQPAGPPAAITTAAATVVPSPGMESGGSSSSSSPVTVVARQEDSLEYEIQPIVIHDNNKNKLVHGGNFADETIEEGDKEAETQDNNDDDEAEEEEEEEGQGSSLFMQLLWIRLFPLTPYWFINLASPLIGVPLWPFMTSMFIGVSPYNYLCAQAGAILGEIHELRDIYQQPRILLQICLVVVLMAAAVWATKHFSGKQKNKKKKTSSKEGEEGARSKLNRRTKSRSSDDEAGSTELPLVHRNDDEEDDIENGHAQPRRDEARQALLGHHHHHHHENDNDSHRSNDWNAQDRRREPLEDPVDNVELAHLRAQFQRRTSSRRDSTVIHINY